MAEHFGLLLSLAFFIAMTIKAQLDNEVSVAHVYADVGSSVSLSCSPQSLNPNVEAVFINTEKSSIMWIREGKALQHSRIEPNGSLSLMKIAVKDAGIYICQVEDYFQDSEQTFQRIISKVELHVKTTPPAPVELKIYPSTVLALVTWKLNGTGGYPIKKVTVIYQKITDDFNNPSWHRTYPEHVGPGMTQLEVYKLESNTSYRFRVWATNKLGPGDYTESFVTTKAAVDEQDIENNFILNVKQFDTRSWILAVAIIFGSVGMVLLTLLIVSTRKRQICKRSNLN
nr:EOG090X0B8X [Cyclestheria hislopi]